MRLRTAGFLLLAGVTFSLTHGQDRLPVPKGPTPPQPILVPVFVPPAKPIKATLDMAKLSDLQQQMVLAAQRSADWLSRMNGDTGHFTYGSVPALWIELEGDHFLHQAGAAFALARAARFTGKELYAVQAAHTLLSLLDETMTEQKDPPPVRYTSLPSIVVNRLGAAGLLVLAINELPAPQADLLEKSEQLCNFIRTQVRPDGSLSCGDAQGDGTFGPEDPDAVNHYPGLALYALMRSQLRRPAPWKTEAVRKAVAYYHPLWRKQKNMALAASQTAAYAEAFLQTKEQPFAACVFEMNDWLCGLQYQDIDPGHKDWLGGFMTWSDDKPVKTAPQVTSAVHAEGLVQASRVARELADVQRHKRYTEAVEACWQFLARLQYSDGNTQHFEATHRQSLVGGFYASPQDGNLRIDYTQHALSALALYLEHVAPRIAELPTPGSAGAPPSRGGARGI